MNSANPLASHEEALNGLDVGGGRHASVTQKRKEPPVTRKGSSKRQRANEMDSTDSEASQLGPSRHGRSVRSRRVVEDSSDSNEDTRFESSTGASMLESPTHQPSNDDTSDGSDLSTAISDPDYLLDQSQHDDPGDSEGIDELATHLQPGQLPIQPYPGEMDRSTELDTSGAARQLRQSLTSPDSQRMGTLNKSSALEASSQPNEPVVPSHLSQSNNSDAIGSSTITRPRIQLSTQLGTNDVPFTNMEPIGGREAADQNQGDLSSVQEALDAHRLVETAYDYGFLEPSRSDRVAPTLAQDKRTFPSDAASRRVQLASLVGLMGHAEIMRSLVDPSADEVDAFLRTHACVMREMDHRATHALTTQKRRFWGAVIEDHTEMVIAKGREDGLSAKRKEDAEKTRNDSFVEERL
ncbi:MAG: hypothetical protein Q9218_003428 [Villophora microphyllina]